MRNASSRRGRPRWDWRIVAVLAALALSAGGRYLTGRLPFGVDHTLQQIPWLSLRWDGGPPLFHPYTLAGVPLLENLQAALLYPLRWPFFFVDWRAWYPAYVFLHIVLAIAGGYVLGRAARMRRPGALAVAILYGLGGYFAGRPLNPVVQYASAWMPWLLAGGLGARRIHGWMAGVAFAMILAIGSPHLFLYGAIAFALAVLTAPATWQRGEGPARAVRHMFCTRALPLTVAVLLTAPTLIPGVLAVGRSVRSGTGRGRSLKAQSPPSACRMSSSAAPAVRSTPNTSTIPATSARRRRC